MTNDLARRVYEHQNRLTHGFTAKHGIDKLMYYETYDAVLEAIAREKQMKNWKREWKIDRIKESNPDWNDLSVSINH